MTYTCLFKYQTTSTAIILGPTLCISILLTPFVQVAAQLTDVECVAQKAALNTFLIHLKQVERALEVLQAKVKKEILNALDNCISTDAGEGEEMVEQYAQITNNLCEIQMEIQNIQSRYSSLCD